MSDEFNYKLTFSGNLFAVDKNDFSAFGISKAAIISQARNLIPDELSDELNIDLLPITANLAVVNKFNKNGDGIDSKAAISIINRLKGRPLNIEHKKDKIVGHIVNATLSDNQPEFNENNIDNFLERKDPYYISISAVIYQHVYEDLADVIIDASDPDSDDYKSISTSWELGFNEFVIAKGSDEILANCEIINDPSSALKLKKFLKGMGGKGKTDDGFLVHRLVTGNIYPLGAALTMSPAADVEGVFVQKQPITNKNSIKLPVNKQKSSNNKNLRVDNNKASNLMDEAQFNKLIETLKLSVASKVSEVSEANEVAKLIKDTLVEHSKTWESQIDKEKQSKAELEKKVSELEASNSELTKVVSDLRASAETKEKAEVFNSRMTYVDSNYELNEDETKILASEIKDLDLAEDAFKNYQKRLAVLFAHKAKSYLAEIEKKKNEEIEAAVNKKLEQINASKDQVEEDTEKDLAVGETEKSDIPNNNEAINDKKSLIDKLKENFKVEVQLA